MQQFVVKLPAEVGLDPGWSPPEGCGVKAQQFAIGESLTVEDLAEDQVGGTKGWGFVPSRLSAPRSCAWGHHSSFFSLSKYTAIYSGKTRRCTGWLGSDHLLGQISLGGWRNGICRLNGALDLHRFKSI